MYFFRHMYLLNIHFIKSTCKLFRFLKIIFLYKLFFKSIKKNSDHFFETVFFQYFFSFFFKKKHINIFLKTKKKINTTFFIYLFFQNIKNNFFSYIHFFKNIKKQLFLYKYFFKKMCIFFTNNFFQYFFSKVLKK